jgi:hypothetical protein
MADIDWGQIISAGAQIANTYAQSRARDRASEATFNQAQDRNAQNSYATDKRLDLEALINGYQAELDKAKGQLSEYETRLSAPQSRAENSVRGDILANVQDVGISAPDGVNVTSFSGGLRPSLLSGNSRALGAQMSKEALLDALSGSPMPFSSMAPVDLSSITGRTAPELTDPPEKSGMERVMQQIGLWGGLATQGVNAMNGRTTAGQIAAQGFDPRVQSGPGNVTGTNVPNPWLG